MSYGSCWCGNLRYEFNGDPVIVALCHCLSCHKISGGTNTYNIAVPIANFRITRGIPKSYTQRHESDFDLKVNFCGDCGSTVYKEAVSEMFSGLFLVQGGTIDELTKAESGKPVVEFFVKERRPWLSAASGVEEKREFV